MRVRHSTFSALHNDPIYPGAAITVWDCVRSLTVEDNTFADSDAGITMIRHAPEVLGPVAIRNNDFKLLSRHGISFFLAVDAELVGNSFEQIAGTGENLGRSPALSLVSDGQSGPTITLRDNRFIENDLAIEVTSSVDAAAVFHLDAGRPDDPGRNLFFCNSAPKQSSRPGGDIAIRPALADRARIDLAGNRWDHAPPSMAATATNGLDILSPRSLDIHGPVVHGSRCIARVP